MLRTLSFDFLFQSAKSASQSVTRILATGAIVMVALAGPAQANPKYAGIVVDAKTGKVLYSNDADDLRYPASLTKMMTLYLTFEALESGKITKNSRVPVSRNAAKEPPATA